MIDRRDVKEILKRAYYGAVDEVHHWATRFGERECDTICLCLGPYRNLTTLTGSILFLHPNVQVLNHAGRRIFGDERVDFLADYSDERLERFERFAIRISAGGEKAAWGGSIVHSHAFERSGELRAIFRRSELERRKKKIECLFWKESLRVAKHIRWSGEVGNILEESDDVRFLMPIRNPLDCTKSNIKTGHHLLFPGIDEESTVKEVLRAILGEISWYASLKQRFPDQFFHFYEYELSRSMLGELAAFLRIERDSKWMKRAMSIMSSTSHYEHSSEFVDYYEECLERLPFQEEEIREGLLRFCE